MTKKDAAVSYRLLQRLAERAWDEVDWALLLRASRAMDEAMLDLMAQENAEQQVI